MEIEQIIRRIIREELEAALAAAPRSVELSQAPTESVWLTVSEASERVRRHPDTVAKALQGSDLHGSQDVKGGRWRMRPECVDAWITREPCPHRVKRVS